MQIVFTSGTTAEPRGVVISHGNVLANLEPLEREIGKYLRYERIFHPLRFLNLLPLSHVFGQFLGIFLPQLLAATVIFQDTLNPAEVLQVIKKERVSVVVAVPRLMESLKDKIERDMEAAGKQPWFQRQFKAAKDEHFVKRWWRFRRIHNQFGWKFWAFISGGAALDAETEEFWRRLSFVVIQGYGLTETTSLISLNHPFRTGKRSIGKVLEGREIKLDENGEILVRGANVAAGYWQAKQLQPVLTDEGWFRTGDVGELDAEGNLYFKGSPQERHRHSRRDEHLSRGPGSGAAAAARSSRLRRRRSGAGRQRRALRRAHSARLSRFLALSKVEQPSSRTIARSASDRPTRQSASCRLPADAALVCLAGAGLSAHAHAKA